MEADQVSFPCLNLFFKFLDWQNGNSGGNDYGNGGGMAGGGWSGGQMPSMQRFKLFRTPQFLYR